ncbi:MAG TPA: carboxypeptidase-like regulatory domain-containing protein [Caldisericia bacterium]|nr:carboxypeptidase-like regulatory domain-containing protein [Caldisericia bacterium]HPF48589.1 carboxypeptidase-like regulatory domain-containing protein [Caldisericia bacterium]HPI83751.1 carboxypeptidase-like regulatory domain-containing protein [Caldisericia bacterium]HPQ93044.1 carboxypeptidase-like regulatory domain-containing protein [Caldisericia bacterium]HRV75123.1 carboxypeptidase-like regulatory domain-containing protein [Caldisericia bacterium]
MKRLSILLSLLLIVSVLPTVTAATPTATVVMEAPTVNTVVESGGTIYGRVKFFVEGTGRTPLWGQFMIDGIPGPSFYQTIEAPIDEPFIIFEAELPTTYGGTHEVWFELFRPSQMKTQKVVYSVTVPQTKRVKITSPESGRVYQPGETIEAVGEVTLSGWGTKIVSGYWKMDEKQIPFSETANVAGEAVIKIKTLLPTNIPGSHSVHFVVTSPFNEASEIVSYSVVETGPMVIQIDPIIEGTTVGIDGELNITVRVKVKETGSFQLLGYLLIDGEMYYTLSDSIIGPGDFVYTLKAPTNKVGLHTVQFKLISPAEALSNTVTYRVVGASWVWPHIFFPADGTTVKQGDSLIAQLGLYVGGMGKQKVVGTWMIDDNPWSDLERMIEITSPAIIYETLSLPTDSPGWHKLKFRMTWPQYEESNEVWYRVWGREQPPSFIEVRAIPESPYPQDGTFQIYVRANDDRGIKTVTVQIDTITAYTQDMGGLQVVDYYTPAIGPIPAGEHVWRVILKDMDGLETDYIGKFIVTGGYGSIEGHVLELGSNRPISGATVTCSGNTVTTDVMGHYVIENLGVGEQIVQARHPQWGTAEGRVIVVHDSKVVAPALYLGHKGAVPVVYQVEAYPINPKPGEEFILSVYVRNDGEDAGLSEVVISSPDGAMLVIDPDTEAQYPSHSHVYDPGSFLEHRDGQPMRLMHQAAVVRWNTWGSGVTRKVMLRVTGVAVKEYSFWVRATMDTDDLGLRVNFPEISGTYDQQGWPSLPYTVDVKY